MDLPSQDRAMQFLTTHFAPADGGIQALGVPFYCARPTDILKAIQESDFLIEPTLKPEGERLPLVLQNQLNAPQTDPFRYITANWDDLITIKPADYAMEPEKRIRHHTSVSVAHGRRLLPACAHQARLHDGPRLLLRRQPVVGQ